MAKGGVLGNGLKVGYSLTAIPGPYANWVTFQSLDEIEVPKIIRNRIDSTVHNQGALERNMPGLGKVEDAVLTFLGDLDGSTSSDQQFMFTYLNNGTTIHWLFEIPVKRDQSLYVPVEYNGWVGDWAPGTPRKDKQTLVGKVVFDDTVYTVGQAGASRLANLLA